MDLRELRIERLPGMDTPFEVPGHPGLNLVLGPNGSGKSSLSRAALGLFWPARHPGGFLEATWDDDGVTWLARRAGGEHVAWQRDGQDSPAPEVPSVSQAAAFHLGVLDLLKATTDADDQELAAAVRRQLAGGYDLTAEKPAPRAGQAEKKALETAHKLVNQCRSDQAALARDEAGLEELKIRRAAAQHADERVRALELAASLVTARDAATNLGRQLAARFPATMDRLHADDLRHLSGLRGKDTQLMSELAIARRQIAEAQEAQRLQGFSADPPSAEILAAARETRARAERLQQSIDDLRAELTGAEAALAGATTNLEPWGRPDGDTALDAAALRHEAARARDVLTHTARRDGLGQLRELAAPRSDDHDGPDRTALDSARRAALDWLGQANERRRPWLAALAGLALATSGVLSRPWIHQDDLGWIQYLGWVQLGLGTVVLVLSAVPLMHRPRTRRAVVDHAASGVAAPGAWDTVSVQRHLEQLAADERRLLERELRQDLAGDLERSLEQATRDLAALADHPEHPDPETRLDQAELLHRSASYHQALAHRDEIAGKLRRREEDLAGAMIDVTEALSPWRTDAAAPSDVAALSAAIEALATRAQSFEDARRREQDAARSRDDLDQRSTSVLADAADLLARQGLGPDDDDALRQLVEQLPAYTKLAGEVAAAAATVQVKEAEISELPDNTGDLATAALQLPVAEIREQLDEARSLARSLVELRDQIVSIETRLLEAQRRADLDEALSAAAMARDQLAAVRQSTREAALRQLLLERLQHQYRRVIEPPVIARTRDLLRTFTQGAYEFLMPDDDDQVYRARDTRTGEGLALSQLSDGTRAQLLLAARLAHIGEAERGLSLPLFLDESLTASDPARFRSVAGAVLDLVAGDGRQVFYLTCDPADIEAWQELRRSRGQDEAPLVKLAEVRGMADAAIPARLRPATSGPPRPQPDEEPAAYAVRLGVPHLDPRDPAASVHVFHVADGDLELVHGLLDRGLERVGQLQSLGDVLVDDGFLSGEALATLDARIRALGLFIETFGVGRGRPVPPGELQRSSGVSTSKLAQADALLEELGGNADAFVSALENKGIKKFQQNKQDELVAWLRAEEYLDDRQVLAQDELAVQVMRSLRDDVALGRLDLSALRQLLAGWWIAAGGDGTVG